MEIDELLDRAKTRANLTSDYALGKVLGLSAGNVSNIRKGRSHPSNEVAVKLATLAGLDEMQVIAEIEMRTANSEKKKEFWKHYIESRGIAACLAMTALTCSIVLTPEPAEASILHLQNYDESSRPAEGRNIHYAFFSKSKLLVLKALFCKLCQLITTQSAQHAKTSFS